MEVTNAPIQTKFHFIFASGNILNIIAKSNVITTNEKTKFTISKRTKKEADQWRCTHISKADKREDNSKEISSKNAIDTISPKEKKRVFKNTAIPDFAYGQSCRCSARRVGIRAPVQVASDVFPVSADRRHFSAPAWHRDDT